MPVISQIQCPICFKITFYEYKPRDTLIESFWQCRICDNIMTSKNIIPLRLEYDKIRRKKEKEADRNLGNFDLFAKVKI